MCQAGDKLLLIEAMKTFNEIVRPQGRHGERRSWSRTASPSNTASPCSSSNRRAGAMFDKILIANRGEIALRILRACEGARHRHGRGPFDRRRRRHACAARRRSRLHRAAAGARISYLNIPALLSACEITGADAMHPGYGFLSENARFAEILDEHGITFIGPRAEHIRADGRQDRGQAPPQGASAFPCVPGSDGGVADDAEALRDRRARSAFRCWSRRRPAAAAAA